MYFLTQTLTPGLDQVSEFVEQHGLTVFLVWVLLVTVSIIGLAFRQYSARARIRVESERIAIQTQRDIEQRETERDQVVNELARNYQQLHTEVLEGKNETIKAQDKAIEAHSIALRERTRSEKLQKQVESQGVKLKEVPKLQNQVSLLEAKVGKMQAQEQLLEEYRERVSVQTQVNEGLAGYIETLQERLKHKTDQVSRLTRSLLLVIMILTQINREDRPEGQLNETLTVPDPAGLDRRTVPDHDSGDGRRSGTDIGSSSR